MATSKWYFDLRENTITQDVKEDYVAIPRKMLSLTPKDLAKWIAEERTEYRIDTIENIINIYEDMLMKALCGGNTYVSRVAQYQPSITGVFSGTGEIDPEKNKCQINITPTATLKDKLAKEVILEYSGRRMDLGGANIAEILDMTTGKTDGTVTPGGMVQLKGNKIKCINADSSGIGKLTLYNDSESGEEVSVLGVNEPSKIIFVFPTGLLAGNYRLEIETYYTQGSVLLKEPRTLVCPVTLKIEG